MSFLSPTKNKIGYTFLGLVIVLLSLGLSFIPIIKYLAIPILYLFLRAPIFLFNLITFNKYKFECSGFLCFPGGVELLGALVIDIIVLYLIACIIASKRNKAKDSEAFPQLS